MNCLPPYNHADIGHYLSTECPRKPGVYELLCMENNNEPERVVVERRAFNGLWANIDSEWRPVSDWHAGLTDVRWRLISPAQP